MSQQFLTVEVFGLRWECEAEVFDDEAILISVQACDGGAIPANLLSLRVVKVLEMQCWAAAQKAVK